MYDEEFCFFYYRNILWGGGANGFRSQHNHRNHRCEILEITKRIRSTIFFWKFLVQVLIFPTTALGYSQPPHIVDRIVKLVVKIRSPPEAWTEIRCT